MEPQERVFLQTVWHLLERAGHTREQLQRQYEARVGVYVGAMSHPDPTAVGPAEERALVALSSHASIANRLSFWFDLQGPSVAVDTLCSSGLHAVHHACRSLQLGECRLAIAGGVNLGMQPGKYLGLSRNGLVGSHAGSRSFADGDGYLPAEGVGAVLLKPLADALRDGDAVLAVIKASAINHAGRSAGFGVPSAQAQARLVEENFRASGIDPRTIGYVEAAANGSGLGDAIEVRALARAFRAFTAETGFCAIGSVKSNMGHAEAASGLAQLTKVLLQLQHRQLVPCVLHGAPNPEVRFEGTPFVLQSQLAPWRGRSVDGVEAPLRAAISSFGAGGSNVHLVVEEAPRLPVPPQEPPLRRDRRFVLNARDPQRLAQLAARLHAHLLAQPDLSLARLSHTLCHCREPMECSVDLVAADRDELLALLAHAPSWPVPDAARLRGAAAAESAGGPLVLPDYPFARDRHALPTAPPAPAPARESEAATACADDEQALLQLITRTLREELGLAADAVRPGATLREHGADSMFALRLIHTLSEVAGRSVSNGDLERHPTPLALARTRRRRRRARAQRRCRLPRVPCRRAHRCRKARPACGCCSSSTPPWPATTCRWPSGSRPSAASPWSAPAATCWSASPCSRASSTIPAASRGWCRARLRPRCSGCRSRRAWTTWPSRASVPCGRSRSEPKRRSASNCCAAAARSC